jgi:predicted dehydrogenase
VSATRNHPLRVAVCGLGTASRRAHIPALLHPDLAGSVSIVAFCDRDRNRLHAARDAVASAALYTDVESLLDGEEIDLMVIATPPSSHLSALVAAAERGIDVVCEKPLGLHLADINELRAVANRPSSPLLATVLQYGHAPGWQAILEHARSHGDVPISVEIEVERPGTDPLSADGWRANPEQEGGILGDHAVHHLGLITEIDHDVAVTSCTRRGGGGRETATLELSGKRLQARIRVTYTGEARRNRMLIRAGHETVIWNDDRLVQQGSIRPVGSLSDREFVNALYIPWYKALIDTIDDPLSRRARTNETIMVADLLQTSIAASEESVAGAVVEQLSLSSFARAVLLAFADLGIYLPSHRERLLSKIRRLDPLEPEQFDEFIALCIDARLVAPEAAGRLRLSPSEAGRLAQSLEGGTPVPDVQARDWVSALTHAATG